MKKLASTLCLMISVLLGSDASGSDLNECYGSPLEVKGVFDYPDWDNCQGTIKFGNGDKYVGEFNGAKFQGQGTFTYAGGSKFAGEFNNGNKHGQGTYTFAGGNKYVGEFRDGKQHGQGTYILADGTVKEGIWEYGEFKYTLEEERVRQELARKAEEERIRQELARKAEEERVRQELAKTARKPPPQTKSKSSTQRRSDSNKVVSNANLNSSDLPPCPSDQNQHYHNCFGTYTNGQGHKYTGEFRDNFKHGHGTYTNANGDNYTGEFRDNLRHGHGTKYLADGTIDKNGIWKDDVFQYARRDVAVSDANPFNKFFKEQKLKCFNKGGVWKFYRKGKKIFVSVPDGYPISYEIGKDAKRNGNKEQYIVNILFFEVFIDFEGRTASLNTLFGEHEISCF